MVYVRNITRSQIQKPRKRKEGGGKVRGNIPHAAIYADPAHVPNVRPNKKNQPPMPSLEEQNARFDRHLLALMERAQTPAQVEDVTSRVGNARTHGNLRPQVEAAFLKWAEATLRTAEKQPEMHIPLRAPREGPDADRSEKLGRRRKYKQRAEGEGPKKPRRSESKEEKRARKRKRVDFDDCSVGQGARPGPERVLKFCYPRPEPHHSPFSVLAQLRL